MDLGLNYEAHVPGLEGKKAAPLFIKADPKKAPGKAIADFIPSKHKLAVMKGVAPPPEKRLIPKSGLVVENRDFISGSEMNKIRDRRKRAILAKAKEIYNSYKKRIDEYYKSCKRVNTAGEDELEEPTADLKRAMQIKEFGLPMTKKRALEEAKRVVLGKLVR